MDLPVWQKKKLTERIKLNYRKANLDKIKNTLSSTDWDRLLDVRLKQLGITLKTQSCPWWMLIFQK